VEIHGYHLPFASIDNPLMLAVQYLTRRVEIKVIFVSYDSLNLAFYLI